MSNGYAVCYFSCHCDKIPKEVGHRSWDTASHSREDTVVGGHSSWDIASYNRKDTVVGGSIYGNRNLLHGSFFTPRSHSLDMKAEPGQNWTQL